MTKQAFYKKWLNTFAGEISERDINKYVISYGNYIWHIFSWKLLDEKDYLIGNEAKEAYDKINKCGAMYIQWFEDEETSDITRKFDKAAAFDDRTEVYVVANDFSWTYIKTHEEMCGPYFMKRQ